MAGQRMASSSVRAAARHAMRFAGGAEARLERGALFGHARAHRMNPARVSRLPPTVLAVPDLAVAHAGLADALVASDRIDDAVAHFTRALQLDPALVAAHYALANVFAQTGRAADALPHFEATVRAMPDAAGAHFNFAGVLLALNRLPEAIDQYRQTLKLEPDSVEALNNLGTALVRAGRFAEAEKHYQAALRMKPDFAPARENLEALRKRIGRQGEASPPSRRAAHTTIATAHRGRFALHLPRITRLHRARFLARCAASWSLKFSTRPPTPA